MSRPAASQPARAVMRAGWRLVLDAMLSLRGSTARTGRFSSQAAIASMGWMETSSLPPKPPPQAEGMIRTAAWGMPSTPATSSRSI